MSKTPAATEIASLQMPSIVSEVEILARKSEAKFQIVKLPLDALPKGLAVSEPALGFATDGNGNIQFVNLEDRVAALAGKPLRRKGTAFATTLKSFCDLVQRHAGKDSVVFADANWKAPKFTAVIDYNAQAESSAEAKPGDDHLARFGHHRISYQFPLSEAWKTWVKFNGEQMSQTVFAQFLEDHIHEVASPSQTEVNDAKDRFKTTVANPSDLIDLSRGMEILVGAKIKSKINLASGEKQLVFETEHKTADGNTLTIPGLFVVNVAPFYQGEPMRIFARLRYRPSEGGVVWFYELYRPDLAIEARVTDDLDTVGAETGLPTYHGAPEI
jgi:uncharacterized protein YfdQ (DUF2303 family)